MSDQQISTKSDEDASTTEKAQNQPDERIYPSGRRTALIFVPLLLTTFLCAIDATILATAVPTITVQFHSLNDLAWYNSVFLLTTCAFTLPFGRMYTLLSTKWTYLTAVILFEIGSLVCGVAPNSITLIVGRAIAGMGSAGIFGGALIIIAEIVPLAKRALYMGPIGGVFAIASVVGPPLGGAFTSKVTWRWCFYINLPLGAVAIVAGVLFLRPQELEQSKDPNRLQGQTGWQIIQKFDPVGTLILVPSLVCLLLALQWGGQQYSWSNGRVIGLLVAFGVSFIAWAVLQYLAGENATVPAAVIKQRSVAFAALYTVFATGAFTILVYYLPVWFQAIKGDSPVQSGIHIIPSATSVALFAVLSGGLVNAFGYYVPFLILGSVLMAIGAGLVSTLHPDSTVGTWIGYQIIFAAGCGMAFEQCNIAAQASLPPKLIPAATSIVVFVRALGGSLGSAIAENIFEQQLRRGLSEKLPQLPGSLVGDSGVTNLADKVREATGGNETQVRAALEVYSGAINDSFYLAAALGVLTLFCAFGVEWRNVKTQEKANQEKV